MSQNGARGRTVAPSEPVRPHLQAPLPVGRWEIRGADDLPLLRRAVLAAVRRAGAREPEPQPSDHGRLTLVATELATNALKYGSGPCVASIFRARDGWLLDVADFRPDRPPVSYPPQPGRPGRNGLLIIGQVSRRWGWYLDEDGRRKHVWAHLTY